MWRSSGDSSYGSRGLTPSQRNLEVHLQFWEMQTISWGQREDQWLSGVVVGRQGKSGGKDFKEAREYQGADKLSMFIILIVVTVLQINTWVKTYQVVYFKCAVYVNYTSRKLFAFLSYLLNPFILQSWLLMLSFHLSTESSLLELELVSYLNLQAFTMF